MGRALQPTFEDHLASACRDWRVWLAALTGFIVLTHVQWWWCGDGDEPSYLSIAQHLARGELGRFDRTAMRYAPGYPALIAPAFWFSDRPFFLIQLLHLPALIAMVLLLPRWFASHVGRAGILLAAFVLVNFSIWFYTRRMLSEALFVPLLLLTGLVLQRVADVPRWREALGWLALAAPMAIWLVLTRQVGVWLVAGFGIVLLIHAINKRIGFAQAIGRLLIVAIPAATAVVVLGKRESRAKAFDGSADSNYSELVGSGSDLLTQLPINLHLRISEVGRLVLPGMRKAYADEGDWLDINTFIYVVFAGLLVWGWVRIVRRRADVLMWCVPWYTVFYLFWPYEQATRFVVPMLPMYVLAVWGLLRPFDRHRLSILAIGTVAHLAITLGGWAITLTDIDHAEQWEMAETFADAVNAAPAPMSIHGMRSFDTNRIRFLTDQAASGHKTIEAAMADPTIGWLVIPMGDPVPADWSVTTQAQGYILLQRP